MVGAGRRSGHQGSVVQDSSVTTGGRKRMGKWSWDRLAAGSGIVCVAGLLIGTFLPGTPPTVTDSRAKVIHYFVSHHRRGLLAEIIVGLGLLALIWFIGTVAATVRRRGEDRLAAVALG